MGWTGRGYEYDEDPREEKEYEPRPKVRECPICGCDKNDYLFKQDGDIIGCEYCVTKESVWDE